MTGSSAYIIGALLQFILYLTIAPGIMGILRWLKGRLQGRGAASPLQPYRDLWKLVHRRPVIPQDASWLFLSAPPIILGCYALLGLLIPMVVLPHSLLKTAEALTDTVSTDLLSMLSSMFSEPPVTDLLGVIFIIGLARFTAGLAGLDANAPFGGLGSGREMFFHVLAEPTLLMVVYGLSLKTRTSGVLWLIGRQPSWDSTQIPIISGLILILLALSLVLLAEAGRIPFDNPATHLELTMGAKAIHLEYGGPLLAMLELAEALRMTFFLTLIVNLFTPLIPMPGLPPILEWLLQVGIYWGIALLLITVLAYWEIDQGKIGLRASTSPAFLALAVALIAVIILAVWGTPIL